MNIFILDKDIKKSAKYHSNKHVLKMVIEYGQLLCTAHHLTGSTAPYKKTHVNHPCAIWARNTIDNYLYLANLAKELCIEYTHRYGKRHKTEDVIDWCLENKPNIFSTGLTPFAQAMPEGYKSKSAVVAYRNYYFGNKKHLANWKNRPVPLWWKIKSFFKGVKL